MGYIIIGVIILVVVIPFSIRNQTKYRQEQISKKAKMMGFHLDFEENQK